MQYWLFKSEPNTWSWQDQLDKGGPEEWGGVRNYQARNNMRAMKVGDLGFFYHSVYEKAIVGVVRVAHEIHPDSTSDDPRWECVDIEAVASFTRPVKLEDVKSHPELMNMVLANNSRLSVQPVSEHEWDVICALGGVELPK